MDLIQCPLDGETVKEIHFNDSFTSNDKPVVNKIQYGPDHLAVMEMTASIEYKRRLKPMAEKKNISV